MASNQVNSSLISKDVGSRSGSRAMLHDCCRDLFTAKMLEQNYNDLKQCRKIVQERTEDCFTEGA